MANYIVMLTVAEWPPTQKVSFRVQLSKISTETKYSKRCERTKKIHPLGHGLITKSVLQMFVSLEGMGQLWYAIYLHKVA